MVIETKHILIGTAVFIAAIGAAVIANYTPSLSDNFDQKAQEYIMGHPDVIMSSLQNFQAKQMQKTAEAGKQAVKEYQKAIFEDSTDPRVGAASAPIKIVEFFDYNCGYCKKALENKTKLLNDDSLKIELIFKELPVLGPLSELLSKYSLTVNKIYHDKYFEFHKALLSSKVTSEADLDAIVTKLGLDLKQVKEVAKSEEIANKIADNHKLAMNLNVRGTPGYIIGDTLIPGYIDYDGFKQLISEQEKNK